MEKEQENKKKVSRSNKWLLGAAALGVFILGVKLGRRNVARFKADLIKKDVLIKSQEATIASLQKRTEALAYYCGREASNTAAML